MLLCASEGALFDLRTQQARLLQQRRTTWNKFPEWSSSDQLSTNMNHCAFKSELLFPPSEFFILTASAIVFCVQRAGEPPPPLSIRKFGFVIIFN